MSLFRDTLEADLYRGERTRAFPLRVLGLLLLGSGQSGCIAWLRLAQFCKRRGLRGLAKSSAAVIERRFACYIQLDAEIGPGLRLPHPVGIVIGQGVAVGKGCTIFHHVTLGGRRLGDWRRGSYPVVGDDVVLFAGAVLLGGITIGDRSRIGANAVVLRDVGPDCTAAGNPARALPKSASPACRPEAGRKAKS